MEKPLFDPEADQEAELNKGRNFAEHGTSGLQRYSGQVYEEFLPELRLPRNIKVYREMSSNDPVIGSILYMAEQLSRRSKWRVETDGDTAEDKAACKFLEECMGDMTHTWDDFIAEVLTMLIYGWSWHEIVYKRTADGRINWKRLPGRSQATWHEWAFDENNNILGMVQIAPPNFKTRHMPIEKSLLFRTTAIRNNPEGRSLLRNAYRPWYFKKHIEEIEGIGIERDLAGLPVLTTPEGLDIWNKADVRAQAIRVEAEKVVRNVRRDQSEGLLLPAGWLFQLASTGSRRQFDTNEIINRYDQRIAITMLADLVMLGADKVGSYALADAKKTLMAAALEAQLDNIANVLNKFAVPQLFELNTFNLKTLPRLVHGEVEIPDLTELSRFLSTMVDVGFTLAPDDKLETFLRRIASIPAKSPEAAKLQEKIKQEQKEMQEQQMQQANQNQAAEDGAKSQPHAVKKPTAPSGMGKHNAQNNEV